MMEWNDDMLSAYLDGELPAETRTALEALFASDTALRSRLEQLRSVDQQLKTALRLSALTVDDPLAARIRQSSPARVRSDPRPMRMLSRRRAGLFALAASLFGVVMGHVLTRGAVNDAGSGWMTASGALAQVLELAPSGSQSTQDGETAKVLLSFKAEDGRYCRAFDWQAGGKAAEGLACREADGWQLVTWQATAASTGFIPAAGGSAAVDAAMDALGGSEALDAAAERELIACQWRKP